MEAVNRWHDQHINLLITQGNTGKMRYFVALIFALFAVSATAQTFVTAGSSDVNSASAAGGATTSAGGTYGSAGASTITGNSQAQASINAVAPQFTSAGSSTVTSLSGALGTSTVGATATSSAATLGNATHFNQSSLP